MDYFSTFSGIGGFELGIGNNHQCVGFSEINKKSIQIYQKHFSSHKNYGDITKIKTEELPNFELLCGGFPCQAFSVAGKRRGFEDTRGTLFFEVARIVKDKKPRLLFLENVKGLLNHDNGRTFKTIITTLDELGYDLQWQVLNSKNHGVPQKRERIYIIGHLRGTSRPEVFPYGETNQESVELLSSKRVQDGEKTRRDYVKYEDSETSVDSYINKASWKDYIYDSSYRTLTILEQERVQGFPDNWTEGVNDSERMKAIGNAVTPNVIKNIMSKL